MKPTELVQGPPGHPLHPPLTDVAIGLYTGAAAFAVLSALGVSEANTATAWWLALVLGLVATVPTALTGLAEWLGLERGTERRRTATTHMLAMVAATVVFLLTAFVGHGGYVDKEVTGGALALTLLGYGLLAFGGFLGGSLVFTHGIRVLERGPRQVR
jgi:uncharacterized membrane protein